MCALRYFLISLFLITGLNISLAAAERPFAHKGVAADAARYETYIRNTWRPDGRAGPDVRQAGERLLGSDPRAASRTFAIAVATDATSPESWIGLAKALLAIAPDPNKSESYDLPVNASGAAYRAYMLAQDPAMKARALAVLGEAMQRRSYWRPAIEALKLSLALVDDAGVRDTYEKLRVEHGFRMTDYTADGDAATPRVCIQFSESLSRGQVDFAKFVSVNGGDPQSVSAEGSQLCLDGVEHGERYEIQVRAGLPSDVDEPLEKPVTLAVYVPDRKPMVHFTGKSYVLPARGQNGIPLVAVNTKSVDIEVYRIGDRSLANALGNGDLDRQLQGYQLEELKSRSGSLVYTGALEVASKLNAEVTVAFPVSEAIGELKPGAYAMIARPAEQSGGDDHWREQATQWFIVSDLGLTAFSGDDGVHAFVRSLASANPIGGASVRLVARNNEVLATATSDRNGYVRFDAGHAKGEGGNAPAILVAETGAGEYAFLDLTSNAFDLSDRGVKGRDAPGPLDGFLYTERGVYRPGEEVNVTALARDATGAAATLPMTLIVVRPDGVEYGRFPLTDSELGGHALRLPLGGGAMTGTWRARLHADPKADAITQVSFLVEDYVPERLDLTLTEGRGRLAPEETKTVDIAGRFLYGPPAAGMAIEGDVIVRPSAKDLAGYEGYRFGEADESVSPVRQPLEGLPTTDDAGKAALAIALPAVTKTARPLEANVIVRLREAGGRTIERSIVLPVSLDTPRIGIKPLFNASALGEGETARFDVVLLDAEDKQAAGVLDWTLVRLDTSWQWYRRDGYWTYESQTITRKVANGIVDAAVDAPATVFADVDYGRYRLEVSSADAGGALTSVVFNAGWYTGGETAESPEMLDVALDKATYQPGETAKLRIASKQGGKALVAVLGRDLISAEEIELPKGGGDVEITVGDDWGPGAYATALVYRPLDETAKRMPSRAIGVRWIGVDQAKRTLKVAVATEAKVKGASELAIPVQIEGLDPGEEARVTIAAVDVGILNLTRYQAPAPETHFYAQQKLALDLRDFYGRLIDGMRAERGTLRSGGDGMDGMGFEGSPPVEETVSYFSGIVNVGPDGTATVRFALPSFNGTVRVMAVAWTKSKVGHGTSDVIVRDAVALTASAPRFLTLGDEARVDLSLHNVDGPAGTYTARLSEIVGDGVPLAETAMTLEVGERKSEHVILKPHDIGTFVYDVSVTGPEGLFFSRRLQFDVKPPAGDIKRTTVAKLRASGKLTLSNDLIAGLIPNRTRINLSVGPAAALDVPGLLTALDRYPYGCAEQTVSRALPLLYANAVAARIGIGGDAALKERVQQAIGRVFEMQDASGAFGSWGPRGGDLWLTSYVTDFLTRARESGYEVRQIPFGQALDRLQNFALNGEDFKQGGEDRAYALYVLARNGRAPIGELRYYADTRLDRFTTPLAKAQLGAALAMVGDKARAESAFRAALDAFGHQDKLNIARPDYGSEIRDGAALVTLASEAGIVRDETPRLVAVVSKAYLARTSTSTQEQAWMLLAAHAIGEETKAARLSLDGAPVEGAVAHAFSAEDLERGVTVTNDGESETTAVVTVIGASLAGEPPVAKGFTVTRRYYTLDGKEVSLESANGGKSEIAQNDRLVAVLTVEGDEAAGRPLLVDRLPAGLEIENPRLVDSGDIKTLDWLKTTVRPVHTEFRDDRFVAAFDLWEAARSHGLEAGYQDEDGNVAPEAGPASGISATVAYVVRAVTPGTFVHPAATVEDMYRPERHARSGAGTLVVTPMN